MLPEHVVALAKVNIFHYWTEKGLEAREDIVRFLDSVA